MRLVKCRSYKYIFILGQRRAVKAHEHYLRNKRTSIKGLVMQALFKQSMLDK